MNSKHMAIMIYIVILDVCCNAHAAKHLNEEGYETMSTYMMSIIQDLEESDTKTSFYDEEIILEGP